MTRPATLWTPERAADLARRLARGERGTAIAAAMGLRSVQVRNALKRLRRVGLGGVPPCQDPPKVRRGDAVASRQKRRRWTREQNALLCEMYSDGVKIGVIAATVGRTYWQTAKNIEHLIRKGALERWWPASPEK